MINREEAVLIFIDVQRRLAEKMHDKRQLFSNLECMIACAQKLDVPILLTEQIPEKLGGTSERFRIMLESIMAIEKTAFSCCGEPVFTDAFEALGKKQAILVGIEAHVCVYQTALDLLKDGIEVFVVADGVSSRTPENKALALDAMRDAGAKIIPTETAVFALLRDASDPCFKELLKLIK
jgi:nicotinamidase-related amidase